MLHNPDGKFAKGHPKIGGNKKGSLHTFTTFKRVIIEKLENNPELIDEISDYYLNNKKMRELLWKMLDGLPTQPVDHARSKSKPL